MGLSYEQYRALRVMRDSPGKEGTVIAKEADCSWDELYELSALGLADIGADHAAKELRPRISVSGRFMLAHAEREGIL